MKLSGTPSNLHACWDDALGTANDDHAAAIAAAHKLKAPTATLAKITDEAFWIDESFQAAKTHSYKQPIGVGDGPFTASTAYTHATAALARKRVALAGARLAHALTDALK